MAKITKAEAIEKLKRSIRQIEQGFIAYSPNFKKWNRDTELAIKYIFGVKSNHCREFRQVDFEDIKALLQSMLHEVQEYWDEEEREDDKELAVVLQTIWNTLHPRVADLARSRFESGHYADAVEAVLKEVNSVIKNVVKEKTGEELDGAKLMNRAFSVNNPIFKLGDLSTETGKSIQQGYMQIFAGTMTGIRNPKAHDNIVISEVEGLHHLYLASLLMHKIDKSTY